jgi:hypothetical protein
MPEPLHPSFDGTAWVLSPLGRADSPIWTIILKDAVVFTSRHCLTAPRALVVKARDIGFQERMIVQRCAYQGMSLVVRTITQMISFWRLLKKAPLFSPPKRFGFAFRRDDARRFCSSGECQY